jgi:hypothetical protein
VLKKLWNDVRATANAVAFVVLFQKFTDLADRRSRKRRDAA